MSGYPVKYPFILKASFLSINGGAMKKRILDHSRIRSIQGGFAFIPHRFLKDGFLKQLQPSELLVYLFLVLVSDAYGLSYYSDKTLSKLLKISLTGLMEARQSLIDQDLIAYDPPLVQVLELPSAPAACGKPTHSTLLTPSSFRELSRLME
jgi:hypothetical protein